MATPKLESSESLSFVDLSWGAGDIRTAFGGIAFIRGRLEGDMPHTHDIRIFRPHRILFASEQEALDPANPHGEAHYGRGALVLTSFIRVRRQSNPGLELPERVILTAFQWHDLFQGRWENNPTHGPQAADAFLKAAETTGEFLEEERRAIAWLLYYHSDLEDPPESALRGRYLEALHTLQDVDASDLMRTSLRRPLPVEAILLRTPEARFSGLPYVVKCVEAVARFSQTGDLFEDQLLAGERLGLLAPSSYKTSTQLM